MGKIPTPEMVTAKWLTQVLQGAGYRRVVVDDFSSERIGTGQLGKCIRYVLMLGDGGGDAPSSLVVKFPSDDPLSRQTGVSLDNYHREILFYRELDHRVSIRTPRCYFAAIDGHGPEFVLVLEDMAPAEQGDQISGCSVEVAEAAVGELVGLHAPSWQDESLTAIESIGSPGPERSEAVRQLYNLLLPGFVERHSANLEQEEMRIIERAGASQGPPFAYPARPFSLIHVDYRLDNLLIDYGSSPPRVTVVDWQSVTVGSPLSDVAYFLGASLRSESRRQHERDLVAGYHRGLLEAGVRDYDWDQCWTDYRRGVFAGFAVTVVAATSVAETERGNEMFATMARRHARHALDLGAEEFL